GGVAGEDAAGDGGGPVGVQPERPTEPVEVGLVAGEGTAGDGEGMPVAVDADGATVAGVGERAGLGVVALEGRVVDDDRAAVDGNGAAAVAAAVVGERGPVHGQRAVASDRATPGAGAPVR